MSRFAGRRPYQFQNADVASYSLAGFGVKIPNIPPSAADDPGSPEGLARGHTLQPTVWPGVYDLPWGTPTIRLIVLNAEEVIKHLTTEERLRGLGPEELRKLQDYFRTYVLTN